VLCVSDCTTYTMMSHRLAHIIDRSVGKIMGTVNCSLSMSALLACHNLKPTLCMMIR
jgi:hypothetical protein